MLGPPLIERSILEHLRLRPGASVQQLSEQFSLATSTIVSALARLQEKQLVTRMEPAETDSDRRSRGRPTLNYQPQLPGPVAAFSFDGSELGGAVLDSQGRIMAHDSRAIQAVDTRRQAIKLVEELLLTLLVTADIPLRELAFIALSPNAVRTTHGSLTSSVLPWVTDGLDKAFASELGIPVHIVTTAPLLAEYQHLSEPVPPCMLQLNFSDGVSCHSVVWGQVFTGANALAGELGHVTVDPHGHLCGCGRKGCLETLCSGPAIVRAVLAAMAQGGQSKLDARTLTVAPAPVALELIWRAWVDRDPVARSVMEPILDRMAWGLSLAVNLYDPDIIRVRGYVLQNRRAWMNQLHQRAKTYLVHGATRQLHIQPAQATPQDILRISAFLALREHLQTRPSTRSRA